MSFYNKYPATNLSQPNMRWIILQIKKLLGERRVNSINGVDGSIDLKTINGNDLLGEGDIRIQGTDVTDEHIREVAQTDTILADLAGKANAADIPSDARIREVAETAEILEQLAQPKVSSINGSSGALGLKTINGNTLLGTGDITISAAGVDDILKAIDETHPEVWTYTFTEATTTFELTQTPDGTPFHYKSMLYEFHVPAGVASSPAGPIYIIGNDPTLPDTQQWLYTWATIGSTSGADRYGLGRAFNFNGIWRNEYISNISTRYYVIGYGSQSMPNYYNRTKKEFDSIIGIRGGNFSAGGIPEGTTITIYGIKDMRYY